MAKWLLKACVVFFMIYILYRVAPGLVLEIINGLSDLVKEFGETFRL